MQPYFAAAIFPWEPGDRTRTTGQGPGFRERVRFMNSHVQELVDGSLKLGSFFRGYNPLCRDYNPNNTIKKVNHWGYKGNPSLASWLLTFLDQF